MPPFWVSKEQMQEILNEYKEEIEVYKLPTDTNDPFGVNQIFVLTTNQLTTIEPFYVRSLN